MTITLPELSLVVLVGPSGAGKTTFVRRHFRPTEILSSDAFRAMITDDEGDQTATPHAFELLHLAAAKRLGHGRLTVIDATNVHPDSRRPFLLLARRFHVQPVALVFDLPLEVCLSRAETRTERRVADSVVRHHHETLLQSIHRLTGEGFRNLYRLSTPADLDRAIICREPLPVNRRFDTGPFDIIGDVHGCREELTELLLRLDYRLSETADADGVRTLDVTPPPGRKAVFVGDLVDRGPDSAGVLRLVMRMGAAGHALCVRGNHDDKLLRKLQGRQVTVSQGLAGTLDELGRQPPGFVDRVREFLTHLPTHYVLDGGRLVVAHAGLREQLQGRESDRVRAFALFGETTGETDEAGLPVRLDWAADYRGQAMVVYGHTPIDAPGWRNRTICIDTGCVFGGQLTALQYPESRLIAVPAGRRYAIPKRPFATLPRPTPADPDPIDG